MSKVFSVDAETDGLQGAVWAIGAIVLKDGAEAGESFIGMIDPAKYVTDPWVKENVVPYVNAPTYPNPDALLNAFWAFWLQHKEGAVAVADFGVPVEARLFRECIGSKADRTFQGPYPLHELGTLFLAKGLDPDTNRREFIDMPNLVLHNPLDDAIAAGLAWKKLEGMTGYKSSADPAGAEAV